MGLILMCGTMLLLFTVYSGSNLGLFSQENLFNYFFLLLIVAFLCPFVYSMNNKMSSITERLNWARRNIKEWKNKDLMFHDDFLKPLYEEYLEKITENKRIKENAVDCDITDYINVSVLNSKINKPVCDIVPATLTGLGLLGTFAGLILGLKNFNTDYESMQTSITNLLSGIRTAFMTSIYGVVFSLVYNWIYKSQYSCMKAELDDFHKAFHASANNYAEYSTNSIIKSLNEGIANKFDASMTTMTNSISSTMTIMTNSMDTSMSLMTSKFGSAVNNMTSGFDNSIKAVTNKMNESLEDVSKTIVFALDRQKESLEAMVKKYVEESTQKYQKQWNEFKESIESVNTSNKEYSGKISEFSKTVDSSTDKLSGVVTQFSSYTESVDRYQNNITESSINLAENMKVLSERYNDQNNETRNLSADVRVLNESVEKISAITSELGKLVQESENERITFTKTAYSLAEKLQESAADVNARALHASEMCEKLAEKISMYSERNMEESISTLRELSADFKETSEKLGSDYKELSESLQQGLSESFGLFDTETSKITAKFADLLEDVRDTANSIPEKLSNAVEQEFELQRKLRRTLHDAMERKDDNDEMIYHENSASEISEEVFDDFN